MKVLVYIIGRVLPLHDTRKFKGEADAMNYVKQIAEYGYWHERVYYPKHRIKYVVLHD
jgi:hypothetical protein